MWVPWEATHQLNKSLQLAAVSWSLVGDKQIRIMPPCPLPKNQIPNQSESWLSEHMPTIPWFIHIDLISDLIDDLIDLIKSMPTLLELKTAPHKTKRASLASWLVTSVYVIAVSLSSGEVATTEHRVPRPFAISRECWRCRLYNYFHNSCSSCKNNTRSLRYVILMMRAATGLYVNYYTQDTMRRHRKMLHSGSNGSSLVLPGFVSVQGRLERCHSRRRVCVAVDW